MEFDERVWSIIEVFLPDNTFVRKIVLEDLMWFVNRPKKYKSNKEKIEDYRTAVAGVFLSQITQINADFLTLTLSLNLFERKVYCLQKISVSLELCSLIPKVLRIRTIRGRHYEIPHQVRDEVKDNLCYSCFGKRLLSSPSVCSSKNLQYLGDLLDYKLKTNFRNIWR